MNFFSIIRSAYFFSLLAYFLGIIVFFHNESRAQNASNKPFIFNLEQTNEHIIAFIPWEDNGFLFLQYYEPTRYKLKLISKDYKEIFETSIDKNLRTEPKAMLDDNLQSTDINRVWSYALGKKYAYFIEKFQGSFYIHQVDLKGDVKSGVTDRIPQTEISTFNFRVNKKDELLIFDQNLNYTISDILRWDNQDSKFRSVSITMPFIKPTNDITEWSFGGETDSSFCYFRFRDNKVDWSNHNYNNGYNTIKQINPQQDSTIFFSSLSTIKYFHNKKLYIIGTYKYLKKEDKEKKKTTGGILIQEIDSEGKYISQKKYPIVSKDFEKNSIWKIDKRSNPFNNQNYIYLSAPNSPTLVFIWDYNNPFNILPSGAISLNDLGNSEKFIKYLPPHLYTTQDIYIFETPQELKDVLKKSHATGTNKVSICKLNGVSYAFSFSNDRKKILLTKLS